jgi:ubiquinone/menaquinone biosynthesis C-methylase UbiE
MPLNKIVEIPFLYDFFQFILGLPIMDHVLMKEIEKIKITASSIVLDLGGGTGLHKQLFPDNQKYVCIDLNFKKIQRSVVRYRSDFSSVADGMKIPFKARTFDFILLTAVTHHLPNNLLPVLFSEIQRVIKEGGFLLLYDPVISSKNLVGKMLYKLDLGKYPRSKSDLYDNLTQYFIPISTREMTIFHSYLIFNGTYKSKK